MTSTNSILSQYNFEISNNTYNTNNVNQEQYQPAISTAQLKTNRVVSLNHYIEEGDEELSSSYVGDSEPRIAYKGIGADSSNDSGRFIGQSKYTQNPKL